MIPLHPGEAPSVRAPGRLHHEVAAPREALGPAATGAVDDRDRILAFVRVDVCDPTPVRADRGRGHLPERGCDRLGRPAAERPPVNTLVVGTDEEEVAVGEGEVAPAVADIGSHGDVAAEVARGDVRRHWLAGRLRNDNYPAVGAAFEPAEGAPVAVPARAAQTKTGSERGRGHGALPEAIAAVFGHGRSSAVVFGPRFGPPR